MKNLFSGFYRLNDEEYDNLWKNCVFVLDSSFLLNLYRLPQKARDELLSVLSTVSDRLWVPYQAALEFHRNRLSVIAEQKKKFSDVRSLFSEMRKDFKSN